MPHIQGAEHTGLINTLTFGIRRGVGGSHGGGEAEGAEHVLRDIRDPRRRQGRTYPLASILTMLTLAAVNGAARDTPAALGTNPRPTEWAESPPQYGTLWNVYDKWKKR